MAIDTYSNREFMARMSAISAHFSTLDDLRDEAKAYGAAGQIDKAQECMRRYEELKERGPLYFRSQENVGVKV